MATKKTNDVPFEEQVSNAEDVLQVSVEQAVEPTESVEEAQVEPSVEESVDALDKEQILATLAEKVAKSIDIPVIGIGAGVNVDGQVLVYADMLGMTADFAPKFLRRYADLHTIITDAVGSYITDVKACDFPNEKEQY